MHPRFEEVPSGNGAWAALGRPIAESRVMLVTSAGVHHRQEPAFDLTDPGGDGSFRTIDCLATARDLIASHGHYDTEPANTDVNVVFPIDALKELKRQGRVGDLSPVHFGFMGFIPDPKKLGTLLDALVGSVRQSAPDAVVLSPG
jgi:D-proline reductase (dithiol) PrdB